MGNIKGVGRIYRQTFIDTYAKVATVKLYDRKVALVAADMLNDRVIPMYAHYGIPLMRILTDRGMEYCGSREHHEYQLYLAIENIDYTKTKAKSPQTNGICERFHRTIQEEFYAAAFRKKIYSTIVRNCNRMLIYGYSITIMSGLIQGDIVSVKHPCRLGESQFILQKRKC